MLRQIGQCLNAQLKVIFQHTQQLSMWNEQVQYFLPIELKPHCHVIRFQQGRLVLMVSDPVWSCQLRYFLPQLREQLRQVAGFQQLSSITLQLKQVDFDIAPRRAVKPPVLTSKAREIIRQGADLCQDSALKGALLRLARLDRFT